MEEKRILVTVDGEDNGEKKSWKCKFDLTDPNVWIQLVLVLLVLGLGTSTVVLATNQDNSHAPPPSPPSPPPPPNTTPSLVGLGCGGWSATSSNLLTTNTKSYVGVAVGCAIRITDQTLIAINEYVSIAKSVDSLIYSIDNEVNLKSKYKKVIDALAAGGLSLQSLPGLTFNSDKYNMNDILNGVTTTSESTIYYNNNPITISSGYIVRFTFFNTKYIVITWDIAGD